jgi:N-acetylmuramoyl-L-alanine amidase
MAKYIILDSGHAKVTGGKRSPDSSLLEWEFNNDMQYRLKRRFEELGFVVYLVNPNPEKGSEVSLANRCSRANSYWSQKGKPDCLYISLHANAAGTGGWSNARGVEVYTASNASAKSKNAAKLINDQIFKDVYAIDKGFKNRGHKTASFYVIKHTDMPSVLIEYEFYSNKDGVNLLKNKRDLLCEATVKSVCQYFNVNYKGGIPNIPKNINVIPEAPKDIPNKNTGRVNGQYPVGTYNRNARVNVNSLNVRKGRPRTGGYDTILGQLKKGEVVKVGYCLGNWFGIIYKGQQAFICGDYVELE